MAEAAFGVTIAGGGIAAACCAHLLARRGLAVTTAAYERRRAPAVMLSGAAVALIRDVMDRADLFVDAPRIARRIVAWGGGDPVAMPHDALVVDAAALATLADLPASRDTTPAAMTIRTDPRALPAPTRFGARIATAASVLLRHDGDARDCWIESLDAGWLFLIPCGARTGSLLSVGLPLDEACDRSRHVAARIILTDEATAIFDPVPRLAVATGGEDWIGCGSAAIAFDPIGGDGTAQTVRAAILAAAVVAGIASGGDRAALIAHYDAMLLATMRRHLALCVPFYRSGGAGHWWRTAHDALIRGHETCTHRLSAMPAPRYVLRDFDLLPRSDAA
ncbi:hypothetical protein COA17_00510 [Sphingomonas ginsenosidimutans]|jgi:hypothetical protein|uniref:Uncharacterized protein n=1 Tax=Sphingomonas ginsenosidimutans TaxID=862134 RepID=A0A2A4I154_9SPHN|nr:hypothetical protein [Sphingomonas ginsenosidimutans]PCG09993.1 hypothetical protein COA17_00510 [Sphingomonas ginsenosidimutans]